MGHLILQGDNLIWPGFSLLGEPSLAITLDETGLPRQILPFLVLSGTTSVSIDSIGVPLGQNELHQLAEKDNVLTTVTISGSDFVLGLGTNHSNSSDGVVTDIAATANSPTTIHSSLKLIDASATTGRVEIFAGATNTSGAGNFQNGGSLNANVTITYTGLEIKGGSGDSDFIENDAKLGIVTDGNGHGDLVALGGAGAKAVLGTGTGDHVNVGLSFLGTSEAAGTALGDKVTFGSAATAVLIVSTGAEAGSTAGTASIGLTKVLNAADGMLINFANITSSSNIVDETDHVVGAANITTAENAAVANLGGPGVAFFIFGANEYFIATNHAETAVNSTDAIVKLVGVHDLISPSIASGVVTLHV